MNEFQEMFQTVTRSRYHDQMLRFCQPLDDHFGINHFWYYNITKTGDYCFLGTNSKWCEYCFMDKRVAYFPVLRHPDLVENGIMLMKSCQDDDYQKVLDSAWEEFKINFNINIVKKNDAGVEAFGFATRYKDPQADERLINELPLLNAFINAFKEKHEKLFELLDTSRVNLVKQLGARFFERPKTTKLPSDRQSFLRKIGYGWILCLTPREQDILSLIPSCSTSQKIADTLNLSTRTVENYLATIKAKLFCSSKAELMQKALEFVSLKQS